MLQCFSLRFYYKLRRKVTKKPTKKKKLRIRTGHHDNRFCIVLRDVIFFTIVPNSVDSRRANADGYMATVASLFSS